MPRNIENNSSPTAEDPSLFEITLFVTVAASPFHYFFSGLIHYEILLHNKTKQKTNQNLSSHSSIVIACSTTIKLMLKASDIMKCMEVSLPKTTYFMHVNATSQMDVSERRTRHIAQKLICNDTVRLHMLRTRKETQHNSSAT